MLIYVIIGPINDKESTLISWIKNAVYSKVELKLKSSLNPIARGRMLHSPKGSSPKPERTKHVLVQRITIQRVKSKFQRSNWPKSKQPQPKNRQSQARWSPKRRVQKGHGTMPGRTKSHLAENLCTYLAPIKRECPLIVFNNTLEG